MSKRVILGKKIGMTSLFDEHGVFTPVTVVEAGPCSVVQVKTVETDGYEAVKLGYADKKRKNTRKPQLGEFKKAGIEPKRKLKEFRDIDISGYEVGGTITVEGLERGTRITVCGTSKGRGFAGVVKRHNFAGGPKTHGQSDRHRAPGSIGCSAYPSRVIKGTRMAGHMGARRVTVKGLRIVDVIPAQNLLLISGAVPGARNGFLEITAES
jgi:large subunit ribosomal protein L3